jgi:quercetin dioxygenase-like cupin family protein
MADTEWNRLYYDSWVKNEGIDLFKGYKIDNVFTQPLKPWARTGGLGMQIQLDGTGELNAAYLCEIPAGGQLKRQRHLYEEIVFILKGSGSTTVWYEGMDKNSFEWQAGSLFAIPLNAWYQHFNGSGQTPARYLAVNTAPIMMNLIRSDDFIFNNDAVFPERYWGEQDYFSGRTKVDYYPGFTIPGRVAISNFFADVTQLELADCSRGVETKQVNLDMANGILAAHILEVPGGTRRYIYEAASSRTGGARALVARRGVLAHVARGRPKN